MLLIDALRPAHIAPSGFSTSSKILGVLSAVLSTVSFVVRMSLTNQQSKISDLKSS